MFWHKNINVTTRFVQIHQLFHKILSINKILKSIKGHNSVEKFGKIMCISRNMNHIYHCINRILSKSIHYFLKTENLTSIKGHNSVEKFRKISCACHNGSGTIRTKNTSSWDDSTGTVRTKFRTGLFAQHYWDGSLKI